VATCGTTILRSPAKTAAAFGNVVSVGLWYSVFTSVPPGPTTIVVVVVAALDGLVAAEELPLAEAMPLLSLFFSISRRLRSAFASGVSFILLIRTCSPSRARRNRLCSGSSLAREYLACSLFLSSLSSLCSSASLALLSRAASLFFFSRASRVT